jgi:hypothetical protein
MGFLEVSRERLLLSCHITVTLSHSLGRAMAADEAMLWELSGRLMGCLDDVKMVSVDSMLRKCYFVS